MSPIFRETAGSRCTALVVGWTKVDDHYELMVQAGSEYLQGVLSNMGIKPDFTL